jgi:hypothetical protein
MNAIPRRFWLSLALSVALLGGCGDDDPTIVQTDDGGGPLPPALGMHEVSGVIDAPAGARPARVANSLGSVEPTDDTFTIDAFATGRQLTIGTSTKGTPMLLGWLDPDHTVLSSRTTVEVLLFYAAGGFAIPSEAQLEAMDLLTEMPELDALADTYEDLLVANPDVLLETPADFVADVQELVEDLADTGRMPALGEYPQSRGIIVTGASRSGLRVDTVTGINSITLTNTYRRLAHAYVNRVSIIDESGTETPSPAALTDFEMPSVQGLSGTIGTFVDIIYGNFAYTERSAEPLALPTVDGAVRTRYELTVVGPGASDGDLASLTTAQLGKQQEVVRTFVIRDLMLPLVLSVLIPNTNLDDYLDFVGGADVVQDFANVMAREVPGIWDQAYAGDITGAMQRAYNAITSGGTLRNHVFEIVLDAIADLGSAEAADAALGQAQSFIRIMTALDMFLAVFDATAVGSAVVASNRADVWQIDATEPVVKLTPEEASLAFERSVTFEATVPEAGGSGANLVYTWSCPGIVGTLTDGISGHVNDFESTQGTVTYRSGDGRPGTETIGVDVYALAGAGQGDRQYIGTARATITVAPGTVTIAPAQTTIEGGDTARFTVTVDPEPTDGEMDFAWSTTGTQGSLAVEAGDEAATYTANTTGDGEDDVAVTATQRVDGADIPWGTATARVVVGIIDPQETTSRMYEALGDGRQEGYYSYLFVWGYVFEHIEGVWEYELELVVPSGNPHSLLEVGDIRYLRDPRGSGGTGWYSAQDLIESSYGENVLGLGEGEICYLWAWQPTTNWDLESIQKNLPSWQARVGGDLEMVWRVRPKR